MSEPINAKDLTAGQLIVIGDSVFKVVQPATKDNKGTAILHSGRSMQKTVTLNDWANFYSAPSDTARSVPVEAVKGAATTGNYMDRQPAVETNPAKKEATNALDILAVAEKQDQQVAEQEDRPVPDPKPTIEIAKAAIPVPRKTIK
jgi:hypothetical protein